MLPLNTFVDFVKFFTLLVYPVEKIVYFMCEKKVTNGIGGGEFTTRIRNISAVVFGANSMEIL